MILLIECLVLCMLFYIVVINSYKKNPLSGIHNSPKYWIKGTEDLEKEYKNYKFYISSIPRSLIAGFIISIIVGVIINIIC